MGTPSEALNTDPKFQGKIQELAIQTTSYKKCALCIFQYCVWWLGGERGAERGRKWANDTGANAGCDSGGCHRSCGSGGKVGVLRVLVVVGSGWNGGRAGGGVGSGSKSQ